MLELTLPWLLFPAAVLCDADAFITSAIATPRVHDVCFNSCDSVLTPGFAVQQPPSVAALSFTDRGSPSAASVLTSSVYYASDAKFEIAASRAQRAHACGAHNFRRRAIAS